MGSRRIILLTTPCQGNVIINKNQWSMYAGAPATQHTGYHDKLLWIKMRSTISNWAVKWLLKGVCVCVCYCRRSNCIVGSFTNSYSCYQLLIYFYHLYTGNSACQGQTGSVSWAVQTADTVSRKHAGWCCQRHEKLWISSI